jgi:cytochrome c1
MQCVDCHNRPAHRFEDPDRAVDQALADGRIAASLPFVKKTGAALIQANYPTDAEAAQKIPEGLSAFYRQTYPDLAGKRAAEIQSAGALLLAIYQRNVFPDLKVTWGTYVNNLGHVDAPGCFRCHDGGHVTTTGQTITQDCDTCHKVVAVDEPSPEVLKAIGIVP